MLLCLIISLVRFYHRGEKCERRGSTRGRRGQTPPPPSQKPPTPKPKEAKAQGEAEGREKQQKPPFWAVFRPASGSSLPGFSRFRSPASGSSPAQPHHTIKGNEEQQPHSQPHPALQGRHSVVRTGENGYSSVITSAASRIACSSASESLVRGMSMSGVHSPRVCIITFSAVRDWPSERPAWYSFAISFVSS